MACTKRWSRPSPHGFSTTFKTLAPRHTAWLFATRESARRTNRLRLAFDVLMEGETWTVSNLKNLVEGIFFTADESSTGLQLVDFVAGAIACARYPKLRKWYEMVEPRVRRHPRTGKVRGGGIVILPHQ